MFVNPYMLIGLSMAVLPLVVHLLSRARYRSVDWGAMMFLDAGKSAQSHSRRPNRFLLLLIRAAIIGALAVALARPELNGRFSTSVAAGKGVAVILLDCSASMNFEENGHFRMEMAKDAAKQILALRRGDRVALLLMGQNQSRGERVPTADLWDVGRRIEAAEAGYGRAEVSKSIDDALDALETSEALGSDREPVPVTFYVVSDRQAANWTAILDGGGDWAGQFRQRLARAGGVGRVVVLPVGSAESNNLAVRSVESTAGSIIAGQSSDFEIKIQNVGPVRWASLPLTVTIDRRVVSSQMINLAPDTTTSIHVPVANGFPEPGTHVVSAELGRAAGSADAKAALRPDGLRSDDRFDLVVDIQEPIRVLVITGEDLPSGKRGTKAAAPATAVECLTTALTPFHTIRRKNLPDPCLVDIASAEQWSGATAQLWPPQGESKNPGANDGEALLATYRVIVLSNVERLSDGQAAALEQFVSDGGGLLVAPGDLAQPDEYNLSLFRDGAGLLPAAIGSPTASDWTDQTSLLGFDAAHPLLRFLGGRPDSFLSILIGRYFTVDHTIGAAHILMRYATGEPFMIESPPGSSRRGRVILMTTSLDADWTTLPVSSFFLPLMQSTVRYLGESAPRKLNLFPGEPIELAFDDALPDRTARVRLPDGGDERPMEISQPAGQLIARYTDTDAPGVYTAIVAEPGRKNRGVKFAVLPPREESNLTPLSSSEWQRLEQSAGIQLLDPSTGSISAANVSPAPFEIWPVALGAVFLLALLEMKVSRSLSVAG